MDFIIANPKAWDQRQNRKTWSTLFCLQNKISSEPQCPEVTRTLRSSTLQTLRILCLAGLQGPSLFSFSREEDTKKQPELIRSTHTYSKRVKWGKVRCSGKNDSKLHECQGVWPGCWDKSGVWEIKSGALIASCYWGLKIKATLAWGRSRGTARAHGCRLLGLTESEHLRSWWKTFRFYIFLAL